MHRLPAMTRRTQSAAAAEPSPGTERDHRSLWAGESLAMLFSPSMVGCGLEVQ